MDESVCVYVGKGVVRRIYGLACFPSSDGDGLLLLLSTLESEST